MICDTFFLSSSVCYSQFCPTQSLPAGYLPSHTFMSPALYLFTSLVFLLLKHLHWLLFCHFEEAPDSAFQASSCSCFHVHLESHSWLMCPWHFSQWSLWLWSHLIGWLLSSVGHSWSCPLPGSYFHLVSRAYVSGFYCLHWPHIFSFLSLGFFLFIFSILTFPHHVFKCLTYKLCLQFISE